MTTKTTMTPTEFDLQGVEELHLASAHAVLTGLGLRLDAEGHHASAQALYGARQILADELIRRAMDGGRYSHWATLPLDRLDDAELRMLSRALHRTSVGVSAAGHPAAPFFLCLYSAVSAERTRRDEIALREVAELRDLMDKSGPIQ
ncbi:MAG: hypothetical protein IPM24_03865 [Bryobacterales bacterium]|nr:hypothetical protein [Bryobacterales bacterium]